MIVGLSEIIKFTKQGIYCPKGDFWIDPSRKVNTAIITHGHSDHARRGHREYIVSKETGSLLKLFYGDKVRVIAPEYGEKFSINGVNVSLHPAGHILGASQVLLQYNGIRVVVAGDYKVENDNVTKPFETVQCDVFVTESTFAKPRYDWEPQDVVMTKINDWWRNNQKQGFLSILNAYSLGKSQRILKNIDSTIGRILVNEQTNGINEIYNIYDCRLPQTGIFSESTNPEDLQIDDLLIIPSSTLKFPNLQSIDRKSTAFVSGWVQDGWMYKGDGFAMSDHADWKGLLKAIHDSGAGVVFVQHGFTTYFTKYLKSIGLEAYDVKEAIKHEANIDLF